jgi:hypothetical protein
VRIDGDQRHVRWYCGYQAGFGFAERAIDGFRSHLCINP